MTILVKIGTTLLTTPSGNLDLKNLSQLVDQLSECVKSNQKVIIVTSGAITCGAKLMKDIPIKVAEKQAAASIGQLLLMNKYANFFSHYKIHIGQLLLTKDGLLDPSRRVNALNTINTLLRKNFIPIINENDSVTTKEIKFGDNDELSSIVAVMCNVSHYIILSDIDGVFTDDPKTNKDAKLIPKIHKVTEDIRIKAKDSKSKFGSGGMGSKLKAAEYAMTHGIQVTIANGRNKNVIRQIIQNEKIGTTFQKLN